MTDKPLPPPCRGTAWGYCQHCRRLEPVNEPGLIAPHTLSAFVNYGKTVCEGSGTEPTRVPAPDIPPIPRACGCGMCEKDTS